MVLVDTTVWVDFFTGKPTPQVTILELLISEGQDICVCGLVLTEVLQGVREERQYRKIKSYFENLPFLPMTQAMHLHSAEIYRSLRKRGITVRKPIVPGCVVLFFPFLGPLSRLLTKSNCSTMTETSTTLRSIAASKL